jgi:hypothetical protein
VEVRDAGANGRGVYTRRSFVEGEFIFRRRHSRVLTVDELRSATHWERIHLCELGFNHFAVPAPPGKEWQHE